MSDFTFNDDETRRILREFFNVVSNRIGMATTTLLAVREKNNTIHEYAELLDKWCQIKLRDTNPIDRLTIEMYRDLLNEAFGAELVWHALSHTSVTESLKNIRAEMRLLDTILFDYPLYNLHP